MYNGHEGANGTLTIGWKVATDQIKTSSIRANVTFAKAFALKDQSVLATAANMGGNTIVPAYNTVLKDNADNSGTIAAAATATYIDGLPRFVTLEGRTLYKDGDWNTLALPFDLPLEGSVLEGAIVKELTGATVSGETTTLTFSPVESIKAGKPYLVKWETEDEPIVEPVFADVVVKTLTAADTVVSVSEAAVEFIGYCSAKLITPANPEIYYMTSGNTLKHTGVNRTLRACRAYFRFTDEASVTGARQFVLNFDGDETTGIAEMGHEREDVSNAGDWYTVNGVKIEKPVRKGLFIRNGKKEIVK